ncbi:hypothetical protein KAM461_15190 [Aeromonas hydrophila]|nr:hypothetical protein KAM461_15190 [Aeromonas hydrophila]
MTPSKRCINYMVKLIDNHWATLNGISEGNAEIIAFLLAGAICHAENIIKVECQSDFQDQLLTTTIEALQDYLSLEQAVMPPTLENMLAMVAVINYRQDVVPGLGGNQTPYTVPVITSPLKYAESQDTCCFPLISPWISKMKKIFR